MKRVMASRTNETENIFSQEEAASGERRKNWPDADDWFEADDEVFEELWEQYLADAEDAVNAEFQIFPEPSIQGGVGDMVILDESGQRDGSIVVDFGDWCYEECEMASQSASAEEYKQKYRNYIKKLLSENGWM